MLTVHNNIEFTTDSHEYGEPLCFYNVMCTSSSTVYGSESGCTFHYHRVQVPTAELSMHD